MCGLSSDGIGGHTDVRQMEIAQDGAYIYDFLPTVTCRHTFGIRNRECDKIKILSPARFCRDLQEVGPPLNINTNPVCEW